MLSWNWNKYILFSVVIKIALGQFWIHSLAFNFVIFFSIPYKINQCIALIRWQLAKLPCIWDTVGENTVFIFFLNSQQLLLNTLFKKTDQYGCDLFLKWTVYLKKKKTDQIWNSSINVLKPWTYIFHILTYVTDFYSLIILFILMFILLLLLFVFVYPSIWNQNYDLNAPRCPL